MKDFSIIFKEVLKSIKPSEEEIQKINTLLENFLNKFKENLKGLHINAEIFIGGSFAKNTLIKKDQYDVDVFLRFDKKYNETEISKLTAEALGESADVSVIHGSRDYFRIKLEPFIYVELIPVKKIKNPQEAENTTDLSHLHVSYVNKKINSEKILDEIRIAKAFCHANKVYGAESYIGGFSGYSIELLVIYYKSFLKFIKAISKVKEKIIIDIEKNHKNKRAVMMDLNSAKLQSPVILIDPTFKHRNTLAALRKETFEKFQKVCKEFLKKRDIKFFYESKINLEEAKKRAIKNKCEFLLLEAKTLKQAGDVAGSKLLKFYKHLKDEISRFYEIKDTGFIYDNSQESTFFFSVKNKKEIIIPGPKIEDKSNVSKFKKKHKKTIIKNQKIFAKEKVEDKLRHFIAKWVIKNKEKINEMYVNELNIIN